MVLRHPHYFLMLICEMRTPSRRGSLPPGTKAFTLTDKSANSLITDGAGELKQGYARILPNSGATTPSGVAIFGFRTNDVLVTEAGVPASPLLKNGRIYAEVNSGLDIGLAIANPGAQPANINFSFTKTGMEIGTYAKRT